MGSLLYRAFARLGRIVGTFLFRLTQKPVGFVARTCPITIGVASTIIAPDFVFIAIQTRGGKMILEGILTTESEDGTLHVAPMGPEVNEELTCWKLKPFQTSKSFRNLRRTNRGVLHVTDDSLLLAKAVLGQANDWPAHFDPAIGFRLEGACHWYGLKIIEWDVSRDRAFASAVVERFEVQRPFFGWNRAKHAVLEAAILASRVSMLERDSVIGDLERLKVWVQKTAGEKEQIAFAMLHDFILENSNSNK